MFPSHSITVIFRDNIDIENIRVYLTIAVPFRYKIEEGSIHGKFHHDNHEIQWKIYIKHRCSIDIFQPQNVLKKKTEEGFKTFFQEPQNTDLVIQIGPKLNFTRKEKEKLLTKKENNQIREIFSKKYSFFTNSVLLFETALYQASHEFSEKTNGIISLFQYAKDAYIVITDGELDCDTKLFPYIKHIGYNSTKFLFSTILNEIEINKVQNIINDTLYLFDIFQYKGACSLGFNDKEMAIIYLAMAIESATFMTISPKLNWLKYKNLSVKLGLNQMLDLLSDLCSLNDLQYKIIGKIKKFLNIRNRLVHVIKRNKFSYVDIDLVGILSDVSEYLAMIRELLKKTSMNPTH